MTTRHLTVVGCGANVWSMHQRGLQDSGFEVVGVQDRDGDRAREIGATLGCPSTESLDELLAFKADAVVVLAPHRAHAEIVVAALNAGRHVLCEKPISVTLEEADRMCTTARALERILAVCFQQRTRTEVLAARDAISTGLVGRVQQVDLVARWPRRTSYFATAPWRGTWRGEGGGIVVNQGQHDLDVLTFLLGKPTRLTAAVRNLVHLTETEDTAAALLEWPDGALGTVHLTSAEFGAPQRIEITGTRGRLEIVPRQLRRWASAEGFEDFAAGPGDPYTAPQLEEAQVLEGGGGTHAELYADFRLALDDGTEVIASGEQAAATLEVAAAILVSGNERCPVDLPFDPARHSAMLDRLSAAQHA